MIGRTLSNLALLLSRRAQGHTTCMLDGVRNCAGALVIAHDNHSARWLSRDAGGCRAVSLESLDTARGHRGPVAIDHYALAQLLMRAANRIDELEHRLASLDK